MARKCFCISRAPEGHHPPRHQAPEHPGHFLLGHETARVKPLLVILDGSSGLRKAVRECFTGAWVQRCQVHRMRNIVCKLPKKARPGIKKLLQKAFTAQSHKWGLEQALGIVAMYGMIHRRQRLPLRLEPGHDLLGVHPQLDDLERHPPSRSARLHTPRRNRLRPPSPELCSARWSDPRLRPLAQRRGPACGSFHRGRIDAIGQHLLRLVVRSEQPLQPLTQRQISAARPVQEDSAFRSRSRPRLADKALGQSLIPTGCLTQRRFRKWNPANFHPSNFGRMWADAGVILTPCHPADASTKTANIKLKPDFSRTHRPRARRRTLARVGLGRTEEARADFTELAKLLFPAPPALSAILSQPDFLAACLAYDEAKALMNPPPSLSKP
jgi:hypothetical protein